MNPDSGTNDCPPASPPLTPPPPSPCLHLPLPRIVFNPPQYLQRRSTIHAILRNLASTSKFEGNLRSLLDVGCGSELLLLRSMIPCEDQLPIERLTGIDVDAEICNPYCVEGIFPGPSNGNGTAEERWRGLEVSLLHGDFRHLTPEVIPKHDIIVSTEVIEHLDPEPLAHYALTLLGTMKPRICVITTPNRDFNRIFEIRFPRVGQSEPDPVDLRYGDGKFWREGVPYPMRHHDHRFEWTRKEFRTWARSVAEKFGYSVIFTGVGGLGYGMTVENVDGATVEEHITAAMVNEPDQPEDTDHYPMEPVVAGFVGKVHRVFGECTQIAVFANYCQLGKPGQDEKIPLEPHWEKLTALSEVGSSSIKLVKHVKYSFVESQYPPSLTEILEIMHSNLIQFIPQPIYDSWTKPPVAIWNRQKPERENEDGSKKYMFELLQGMDPEDVHELVVPVELEWIWHASWKLQRSCRFHFDVFVAILRGIKGTSMPSEDSSKVHSWKQVTHPDLDPKKRRIQISPDGIKIEFGLPQSVNIPEYNYKDSMAKLSVGGTPQPNWEDQEDRDTNDEENLWTEFLYTPGIPYKFEIRENVLVLGKNGGVAAAEEQGLEDGVAITFKRVL